MVTVVTPSWSSVASGQQGGAGRSSPRLSPGAHPLGFLVCLAFSPPGKGLVGSGRTLRHTQIHSGILRHTQTHTDTLRHTQTHSHTRIHALAETPPHTHTRVSCNIVANPRPWLRSKHSLNECL